MLPYVEMGKRRGGWGRGEGREGERLGGDNRLPCQNS